MLRLVSVLKEFPAWEGKIDPSAGSDSHIVSSLRGRNPEDHRTTGRALIQPGNVGGCTESFLEDVWRVG